jgi:CubicO group peptidase (beta-lactamase class C family)
MRLFQFLSAIVCTALAQNAVAAVPPDQPAAPDGALRARLAQVMIDQEKKGFWGIVYVAKGGQVLLNEGYGLSDRKTHTRMRRDTVLDSGSLSKQVTAAAAVKLASDGKLSLDDRLGKFFAGVPADKSNITIRQLLSHTSGLQEWVFPNDFVPIPREVWLEKVFSAPLDHPPGQKYLYSNDGITVVAMIIEQVTGKPYRDYIKERFFRPLGMLHTGWYDDAIFKDPSVSVATGYRNGKDDGAPNEWSGPYWALLGNGGILWTPDDMARWHRAVHHDLMTPEERSQLFAHVTSDPERLLYPSETAPMYYGLGWRIGTSVCGDVRIGHTGTSLSHNVAYRYYVDRDILIYAASSKLDVDYKGVETIYSRDAAEALSLVFMERCKSPAQRR